MITWLLADIIRRAGLKPLRGKTGPRVHDLRHSMVVNRILEWYRTGINPQDRLPFLATYLGQPGHQLHPGLHHRHAGAAALRK